MNKYLVPKDEFVALLESANTSGKQKEDAKMKVWSSITNRILRDWNGNSYSFLKALTPGQSALVCCAQFQRGAAYDFLTSITQSVLPSLTLTAFETIQAHEYLVLLKELQAVFPGKKFPEFPEDMLPALRMQPKDYFEKVADSFVNGKGMKRPLHDYVFDYVNAHPEDFCST